MRSRSRLLLIAVALNRLAAGPLTQPEIEQLVRIFGPILKLHSTERYRMDDPAFLLNSAQTTLQCGLVHNPDNYDTFSEQDVRTIPIPSAAALDAIWRQVHLDPRAGQRDFRCWLHIPKSLLAGSQSRAQAFVSVLQSGANSVDLQFWFFYPFNGPGKFRVTIGKLIDDHVRMDTGGRHYGDWEHVTLRLARAPGQSWTLRDIYLSRHAFSKWEGGVAGLRFSGRHPIVYVARDSHAHYPAPGVHYYRRVWRKSFGIATATVDLEDWTDDGPTFDTSQPGHFQILSTAKPPAWYSFPAPWGQYEKLKFSYAHIYTYKEVGGGPHGPAFHGPDD